MWNGNPTEFIYDENRKDDYGLQQHLEFEIKNIATIITHIWVSCINIICVDIFWLTRAQIARFVRLQVAKYSIYGDMHIHNNMYIYTYTYRLYRYIRVLFYEIFYWSTTQKSLLYNNMCVYIYICAQYIICVHHHVYKRTQAQIYALSDLTIQRNWLFVTIVLETELARMYIDINIYIYLVK